MFKKFFGTVQHYLNSPIKNRHIRTAVPFFLFMGIALVVIRECATVRYQFRKAKTLSREEIEKLGYKKKEIRPLEEIYEDYKKVDLDNWENIRGPRLWDETPSN